MDRTPFMARPTSRELLLDAAIAVGLTLFAASLMTVSHPFAGLRGGPIPVPQRGGPEFLRHGPTLMSYLLVALSFLPLALRRVAPVAVLVVTTLAVGVYQVLPNPPSLVLIGLLIALYTAGTLMDRTRLAIWSGASIAVVLATSAPEMSSPMFLADIARNLAVLLTAVLLGDATRNRRAYVAEVERRAAEAERTREEEARRQVDEERLRIARELHDVTAHSLSVIAVQSGAAAHVIDRDPAEARRSLVAIRETSREALQELRAMLGVLRGAEESAPLTPTGGVARIAELVRPLEEAGHAVACSVTGDVGDLPALVDASAFRIVQEALTNVLRHAPGAAVTVAVRLEDDTLVLEVANDGGPVEARDEGHGIAGMRERVAALGGSFEAGPRPGGGWRVAASLPVPGRRP